ncbi:MAG: division/cell wall cluster transcriptional repressor MraZ [Chloroflexi bacterium]|nr:division/cell wall cluster transcriptional repressor MraZ [Chloroflexota bacterium]
MFLGEFEHSIDEKGRITVPAKFRAGLAEGMVITRGLDRCLWVFPPQEWQALAEKIGQLPLTSESARGFERLMFSGAAEATPDGQGRVLVPSYLRTYAGLDSDAIVIGVNRRLEIWSRDRWTAMRDSVEADAEGIAARLAELGI